MIKMFDKTKYTEYYIDEMGRVYSKSFYFKDKNLRGILVEKKPNINRRRGYLYARTRNKNWQIHRLVAEYFLSNPEGKKYVNHKDGNKHNNCVDNLEWVTAKENIKHAVDNGLLVLLEKNNGNIKYTNNQVKEVYKRVNGGMTYREAGSIYDMPYSTVAHIMRGSRRKIV